MFKNSMKSLLAFVFVVAFAAWMAWQSRTAAAQSPTVVRTVLLQHDLAIPGYAAVLVSVEIPVGGREGRHTHPGALVARVEEGAVTLDYEGNPTVTYKAGDSFFVEAGKVHEGVNNGNTPVKLLATFVVEKGKPITSPVQ
jgi:quercetin dioxygenase-like cupin family protein